MKLASFLGGQQEGFFGCPSLVWAVAVAEWWAAFPGPGYFSPQAGCLASTRYDDTRGGQTLRRPRGPLLLAGGGTGWKDRAGRLLPPGAPHLTSGFPCVKL